MRQGEAPQYRQEQKPQYMQEQKPQYKNDQDTGPYWGYLKTPSFILRLIQICLLIPCLTLMCLSTIKLTMSVTVSNIIQRYLFTVSNPTSETIQTVFLYLYYLYIAFAGVLIVFQIIKIILNIANFGDYKPNNKSSAQCVNITLNVFDGLFYAGLALVTIPLVAFAVIVNSVQFIFSDSCFFVSVILVVVLIILRAVLGCAECCKCCKPKENQIRNFDQPHSQGDNIEEIK